MPADRTAHTLRRRLLRSLLVPLSALAIVGVLLDYVQANRLANESYDQVLATTATGLAARLELERDGDLLKHMPPTPDRGGEHGLLYAVFNAKGELVAGLPALRTIAHPVPGLVRPYFHDEQLDDRALRVATYAYAGPEGSGTIVVAESPDKRQQASRRLMQTNIWISLLSVVFTLVVVLLAIRHALKPLDELSERFEHREPGDMSPMPLDNTPGETRPLIQAANGLMTRLKESAEAQQAFVSNTAHQLRTPLAGLQTQLELLLKAAPASLQPRTQSLLQSTQKLSRLTHQLLALARSSPQAQHLQPFEPLALTSLFEDVASTCLDQALARHIDLGFEPAEATVLGSPWMLRELLLNLVDNAIAYTPEGGRVTVSCGVDKAGAGAYLSVTDNGPGIPVPQRERVFERFYRAAADQSGTGLGLAIVKEIADRHGASVKVQAGEDQRGTHITVSFPTQGKPDRL